uniref:Uncharacterized protein n=1 Tax=Brassica oleracea TaxID=3712 RepID=A0A3P6F0K5_BRAOL|nr:unnamed protein product [Brassica oleracea]
MSADDLNNQQTRDGDAVDDNAVDENQQTLLRLTLTPQRSRRFRKCSRISKRSRKNGTTS